MTEVIIVDEFITTFLFTILYIKIAQYNLTISLRLMFSFPEKYLRDTTINKIVN